MATDPASPGAGLVSVVIPTFNEADGIERCLTECAEAMRALGVPFELLVVDDGSTDDTIAVAQAAGDAIEGVRIEAASVNAGKGSALIRGMQLARGELVLFVDADLEVHPRQLGLLRETMFREDADIVIGSKLHPDAEIDYPLKRRILSQGYYVLVRVLFRLPVRDTQTGLKLYRRRVLERVGPRLLVKRFAHDLEVLVNAHRLGYRIAEAPVVVTRERAFPRVGVGDARVVLRDTLGVFYRTYITRYYDRVGRHVDRALGDAPGWRSAGPDGPPDAKS
ncbi:Dodecaprenyl-phosphate galacturonate synthase [Paraconexibacter sp. AEG42_29]|uniref:Dodecaprenyl-phosphate galacturonate synthase n=1 Tax=Paraconexibacter sp. AEG42_29 TaxID=2997339 RepID=A0AAU7ANQ5_9ACTN